MLQRHFSHSLPLSPAELLNEFLGPGRDVSGEVDGVNALQNDVVSLHGVGAGEGRSPGQQLEHEDPEGPVVGGDVMALIEDDLGGDVLRSSTECPRLSSHLEYQHFNRAFAWCRAGGFQILSNEKILFNICKIRISSPGWR